MSESCGISEAWELNDREEGNDQSWDMGLRRVGAVIKMFIWAGSFGCPGRKRNKELSCISIASLVSSYCC